MSATTGHLDQPDAQQDSNALRVRRHRINMVPVIQVEGEIDLSTVGAVRQAVDIELSGSVAPGLILDLEHVTFLCSTGLQLLVESNKRTEDHGGVLCVVSARREVLRPLQLTGLDAHLRLRPTMEEAFAELGATN